MNINYDAIASTIVEQIEDEFNDFNDFEWEAFDYKMFLEDDGLGYVDFDDEDEDDRDEDENGDTQSERCYADKEVFIEEFCTNLEEFELIEALRNNSIGYGINWDVDFEENDILVTNVKEDEE